MLARLRQQSLAAKAARAPPAALPSLESQAAQWTRGLQQHNRELQLQLLTLDREDSRARAAIMAASKRNDAPTMTAHAKRIVSNKKARSRISTCQAHIATMERRIQENLGMARVAGVFAKSAEIMKLMNRFPSLSPPPPLSPSLDSPPPLSPSLDSWFCVLAA